MPSAQALKFLQLIRDALPGAGDIDLAAESVRRSLEDMIDFGGPPGADLEDARRLLHEEYKITILRTSSIFDKRPAALSG
jgi:hypothetical protein